MNRFLAMIILANLMWLAESGLAKQRKTEKPPFQTSESVEYVAEKSDPLIGLLKADGFQGVVIRGDSAFETLQLIDDYSLALPGKAMDETLCKTVVRSLLGADEGNDPAIKILKIESFDSRFGKACEAEVQDAPSVIPVKRYRVVTGIYRNKVRAFVARDKNLTAREGESEELRKFYKSLK